jgi:hypothetical protein
MPVILFRMILVVTLGTVALGLGACAKSDVTQSSASNQIAPSPAASTSLSPQSSVQATATAGAIAGKGRVDACALLTTDEIRSVQGEPLKETKASGSVEGGLINSQCFFALPTFNNSISLVVTQKGDGAGARDPKEFWEATFDKESEAEREKEHGKTSEKEREKASKGARRKS